MSFVCVIPAYRPPEALIDLVRRLGGLGRPIVVVNDGSGDAFDALFRSVARLPNVVVCKHAINLGKGAALRTAMHVCLTRYRDATGSSPSTPTVNTTPRTPAGSAIGSIRSPAR